MDIQLQNSLKVLSYNCKSVKRSVQHIRDLCKECDILALQETWLMPHDLGFMNTINKEFSCCSKSSVDTSIKVLVGRPYGGTALMWRSSAFNKAEIVPCVSDRIVSVRLTQDDRSLLVFSVYMPTNSDDNLPEFTQCLAEISAIIDNMDTECVFILGDFNAHPGTLFGEELADYCGRQASDKVSQLISLTQQRGAVALVLTALDDIAYTLNVRGSDIPYNPVFFSYLIIRADVQAPNNVILFWSDGVLPSDISSHLASEGLQVQTLPYEQIFTYLSNFSASLPVSSVLWLSDSGSHAIYQAAESGNATILSTLSPVANIKCIKNDVELQGFRTAHIKDGIAVVRGLRWVEEAVAAGETVTEIELSDKLALFREQEADSHGPSFATIAGAGENGAVIHYSPPREGSRVIGREDMLLVDSGGQYLDGTTDITRTRHMSGSPTEAQRRAFTRVLKGQILMGTAVFPRGILGNRLETLARKALWDVGLDYAHGTGHGVGHFLNVHEGPSGILSGVIATDPGIVEKMIFSNEPGYYEVGQYGIRHEDLVEVIVMNSSADHIMADSLVGDFAGAGALGFYTISLAPHQTACLDVGLLTDFEIKYINDYHARVLSTLGPVLQERELHEDYEWLKRECAPIARSAAILWTSSPILMAAVMWLRI